MHSLVPQSHPYIDFASPYIQLSAENFYFLDTSFLIAVADSHDPLHKKAIRFWDSLVRFHAGLVVNNIVIGEFVHVYMRTLYKQQRLGEILEQVKKTGGGIKEVNEAVSQLDKEWQLKYSQQPHTTTPYLEIVLSVIGPLVVDRVLEIAEDGRSIILEAFQLQARYHLGSHDAQIVASAKNLNAVLVTTDIKMVGLLNKSPDSIVVIYATTHP